ncbi:hypothetical protein Trydic_g116 [Trypoxylus dichotomus]
MYTHARIRTPFSAETLPPPSRGVGKGKVPELKIVYRTIIYTDETHIYLRSSGARQVYSLSGTRFGPSKSVSSAIRRSKAAASGVTHARAIWLPFTIAALTKATLIVLIDTTAALTYPILVRNKSIHDQPHYRHDRQRGLKATDCADTAGIPGRKRRKKEGKDRRLDLWHSLILLDYGLTDRLRLITRLRWIVTTGVTAAAC